MEAIDRRLFLAGAGALIAGVALPGAASAQVHDPRPPTVDTSNVREIADGVFVIGDHRVWLVPNIGVVLGREAALVIDCGLGPANGEAVLTSARRIAGPHRRLMLTVTHFHPEHGYGAQAFRGSATIVYNRAQRGELAEKGERYLRLFRATQGPNAVVALDGTKIVMPDRVYEGAHSTLDLGGRTVELRAHGLGHTRGDQSIYLPRERILFAGDLIEERAFPIFPYFPPADTELDGVRWARTLREFATLAPTIIVPGHGDTSGAQVANNLAAYMETVHARVATLLAAGASPEHILEVYKPELLTAHPTWDHPQLIDLQLMYEASLHG